MGDIPDSSGPAPCKAGFMSQAPFPALDFPLYGLAGWHGDRWLEVVEGEIGKPAWGVWLAHGYSTSQEPPEPWVRVATLPADRHARLMKMPDERRDQAVAFAALFFLVNVTMPELTTEQRKLYTPNALAMVQRDARQINAWPDVEIKVDDQEIHAQSYSWADTQVVIIMDVDEVALIVISAGVPLEELALEKLSSGSEYHFDLDASIDYPGTLEASTTAALGDNPSWTKRPIHPDQQQLLDA